MLATCLQDVELVQFMGKDNVPFHTVIFPATLIGTQASVGGWFACAAVLWRRHQRRSDSSSSGAGSGVAEAGAIAATAAGGRRGSAARPASTAADPPGFPFNPCRSRGL